MSQIDEFLDHFPQDVQDTIRMVWNALGSDEQNHFLSLISAFPTDASLIKGLIKLSTSQVRQTFGRKHDVAILGPANVGKSTLYNQLVHSKQDAAAIGPLPGTTRETHQADAGLFMVVDTPGTAAVGTLGEQEHALDQDQAVGVVRRLQGNGILLRVQGTEQQRFYALCALT